MLAALIARHQGEAFQKLRDEDITLAAEALAATLETSVRGIVYEHRAATIPAERLLTELKAMVAEIAKEGGSGLERDAALALRRLEAAGREIAKTDASGAWVSAAPHPAAAAARRIAGSADRGPSRPHPRQHSSFPSALAA